MHRHRAKGGGAIRQGQIKLDDRDLKILSILQREGRIPKATLAERVNLTPTPCWERLKRLEDAGIIESYGARISLRAFGPLTVVFVQIELESHQAEDFARFEAAIGEIDRIVECWAVGGGIDYLLKVITRDLEDYQRLIDGLLAARVGVRRYYSYVVTAPVKDTPWPVAVIADAG
ncbi:Lrp/AsnC family transcriptional regulator [Pelagibacterium lacus]|uniref:Lrp/AsnC family transcriptional regulator n=1 Tax=Pelagibacterium lacus TaxID=2282655 RepID=A0A369W294_9HYPH|nr:Lrp/AsnC family transcriptional regulator [Pelagibacterium lacus]RDE08668.1 Lrp/AsnC family transcriptional regulator [Pelagibacterium lacus]